MKVLVTGGAGYIGSHAVKRLREGGHEVAVIDNLFRGHRQAVPEGVPFYHANLLDYDVVVKALEENNIDCVMHFAALAYVGESVDEPLVYYHNNTSGTISLLRAINEVGVKRLVFSSTCATYGEPDEMPITEQTSQSPINPYGWSKLFIERILKDYAASNSEFSYAALRYFNVAGSAADGSIGEDHQPETHLIPVILQAAMGTRDKVYIFGEDYPTPDGTCIRDYVSVEDLVDAYAVVMQALAPGDQRYYNLGIGRGYSVKEVVEAVKKVTGREFTVEMADRRPGDPPVLYADASKIEKQLSWKAATQNIEPMIENAWRWYQAHPKGYDD